MSSFDIFYLFQDDHDDIKAEFSVVDIINDNRDDLHLPPAKNVNKKTESSLSAPKILNGTNRLGKPAANMLHLKKLTKRPIAIATSEPSIHPAAKIAKISGTSERKLLHSLLSDDIDRNSAHDIVQLELKQLKIAFAEQSDECVAQMELNRQLQKTIDTQAQLQHKHEEEVATFRSDNNRLKAKILSLETQLKTVQKELDSRTSDLELQSDEMAQLQSAFREQKALLSKKSQEIEQHQKRAADAIVAAKLNALKCENSAQPSQSSCASNPSNKAKPEKLPPLSKPQLFNGIRRYLNPSMISLLRMEMFADAEREYKPDERQIAMELWEQPHGAATAAASTMGSVYEFMRSEWRFRLPPKGDVLQWIRERDENVTTADDDWDDC